MRQTATREMDRKCSPSPPAMMTCGDGRDLQSISSLLDAVWNEHNGEIYRFFARRLPVEDAADLTQDVFITASQQLQYVAPNATRVWLFRTAANRLKEYFHKVTRSQATVSLEAEDCRFKTQDVDVQHLEEAQWLGNLMDIASEVCSAQQYAVFHAFYKAGSFEEAAQLLALDAATVRSHFLRGRSRLLAHVIEHFPELVGGQQAIDDAIARFESANQSNGLSFQERQALFEPNRTTKTFRSACVKIARYLTL